MGPPQNFSKFFKHFQNIEKPLVLFCFRSQMLKKHMIYCVFAHTMLRNHYKSCAFFKFFDHKVAFLVRILVRKCKKTKKSGKKHYVLCEKFSPLSFLKITFQINCSEN